MRVVGLCGGSGSGKGSAGKCFARRGYPVLDTDLLYRGMIGAPGRCVDALTDAFGVGILNGCGGVDRRALSALVFGDRDKLALLNAVTHPLILEECRAWVKRQEAAGAHLAILDAPLLFESHLNEECDSVIAVVADEPVRLARIMQRDGITQEFARARIAAQMTNEFLIAHADYVIYNNGSESVLDTQVAKLCLLLDPGREYTDR